MTPIPIPSEPSVPEDLLRRIVTILEDAAGTEGPLIHRFRTRPFDGDKLDRGAVVVYALRETGQSVDHDAGREDRFRFRTEVRGRVTSADVRSIDEELDRFYVWLLLAMGVDPSCGGIVADLERRERAMDAVELSTGVFGGMGVDWECTLITQEFDPRETA